MPRRWLRTVPDLASAPVVVVDDAGGGIAERAGELQRLRASGRPVVIAGRCASACTLYLSLGQTCITSRAVLMFHAPSDPGLSPIFLAMYPDGIRDWISAHGGLGPRVLVLPAAVAAAWIPTCPERG